MQNRSGLPSNNKSGVRGVRWDSARSKWHARVKHMGCTHHAGRFDSLAEAEAAVLALRMELHTNNLLDRSK